jgi:hypothetical protein
MSTTPFYWKVKGQERNDRKPVHVPDGEDARDWVSAAWGVPVDQVLVSRSPFTTQHEERPHWVSIGRNHEAGYHSVPAWHQFQEEVTNAATLWGSATGVTVHGTSEWEGVPEDTFLVLVTLREDFAEHLIDSLAALARRYSQEAIGLVGPYGPADGLVSALPDAVPEIVAWHQGADR